MDHRAASSTALLRLLQLASPTLPVGSYSYSEGLETLIAQGMATPDAVLQWLEQELALGLVRLETAYIHRIHQAAQAGHWAQIAEDNRWLSALRDSEESRNQSWATGRALVRLMQDLHPDLIPQLQDLNHPCNFVVGFTILAAHWEISASSTALGYLHSWATNLITATVKLVPLGQTQGQKMLLDLTPTLERTAAQSATLSLDDLALGGWGASLASMQHEALYSRLFRS
ncbi:MAG: Urease accessory protein UreF [Cyanobacteriota bacterium]|jgi:urease accessory protein